MGVGLYLVVCHLLLLLVQVDSKCQKSYTCRNLTLEFPFTNTDNPECGLFMVEGCDSPNATQEHPLLHLGASTRVKSIIRQTSENRFLIRDFELLTLLKSHNSCLSFTNLSLPQSPSVSFTFSPNITFFTCYNRTPNQNIQDYFRNYSRKNCEVSTLYYKTPGIHGHALAAVPGDCYLNQLPIKSDENSTDLVQLLTPSFELEWNVSEACNECFHGGGQCLADTQNKFYCKTGIAYALVAEYFIPRNQF